MIIRIILWYYAYKIVCIDDRFRKPIVVYRGKKAAYEFIKAILEEYKYYIVGFVGRLLMMTIKKLEIITT